MVKLAIWVGGGVLALGLVALGGWMWVMRSVETPAYEPLRAEGRFELRAYPDLALAEVETAGARREALRAGFRPLARYIFASDRGGEKIAMTAPVVQSPSETGWRVAFIMPSARALDSLPAPAGEGLTLRRQPGGRYAAARFSGAADDADFEAQAAALRDWIAQQGLSPAGPPVYAYYDDPMTPGFLRRNEVLIAVEGPPGPV